MVTRITGRVGPVGRRHVPAYGHHVRCQPHLWEDGDRATAHGRPPPTQRPRGDGLCRPGARSPLGHVEDFIVDDESWALRYMVIDTRNWWPGKHVLVPPQWIESVSWPQSSIVVDLLRETIKACAEYNPSTLRKSGVRDRAPPESPARVVLG
jgi:hypothetical protein